MWVQVLFLILGGRYLEKLRIPDSVLLVHSKIATILDGNSALNKNVFMKILSPLPGIKNAYSGCGGYHLRLPCVYNPQCFDVKPFPEMRWGFKKHLAPVLILPKKLLTQASQLRNRARIISSNW